MAEGGVGESHQHAAVAVHHAVGVMLADKEGARIRTVFFGLLVERADLPPEAARPLHRLVAGRDRGNVAVEEIVGHCCHSSHAPCGSQSASAFSVLIPSW